MWNYIALIIYLAILGVLTWYASKYRNSKEFLIASRSVGWKLLAVSIFASILSSYNVVVGLSFSYLFGPWVILIYAGALAAFFVIYFFAKKQGRDLIVKERFISIIDFVKNRFGRINASLFNLSLLLVLYLFISLQFFVNTSIFSALIGWDKYTSAFIVGAIVLAYIFVGGLKVEILTDFFQGVLMFGFILFLFVSHIQPVTKETLLPLISNKTLIVGAVSIAIAQFLTLVVQPEMWQRVYAAKSFRDLKKGFIYSWVLILAFIIPIILIGLGLRAGGQVIDANNIFLNLLNNSPSWFLPIISVSLFAAFMSTLDSSLFALATQTGKYGLWITKKRDEVSDDRNMIRRIRISLVIGTILTLITSLFFSDFLTSVIQLISLLTVNATIVIAAFIFSMKKREISISLIVGTVIYFIAVFGGYITSDPYTVLYPSIVVFIYIIVQRIVTKLLVKSKSTQQYSIG